MEEIRLQKFLANSGIASRRKCEELIAAGKVSVNGIVVTELGIFIEVKAVQFWNASVPICLIVSGKTTFSRLRQFLNIAEWIVLQSVSITISFKLRHPSKDLLLKLFILCGMTSLVKLAHLRKHPFPILVI